MSVFQDLLRKGHVPFNLEIDIIRSLSMLLSLGTDPHPNEASALARVTCADCFAASDPGLPSYFRISGGNTNQQPVYHIMTIDGNFGMLHYFRTSCALRFLPSHGNIWIFRDKK